MKTILGKVFLALLLFAPIAKADGFNPADVFPPNQIAFDFTYQIPTGGQVEWTVEAFDASPQGASFYGYCEGPFNPEFGDTYPWCTTDGYPIGPLFEPAGAFFGDIATLLFGFDPGLFYSQAAETQTLSITTPEPGSGIFTIFGMTMIGLLGMLGWLKRLERLRGY